MKTDHLHKSTARFTSIPGRDGQIPGGDGRTDVTVTLLCSVVPGTETGTMTMARVAGWLRGMGGLRLSESPEFTREGIITGISEPRALDQWIEFDVTFRGKPYLLGSETSAALNQAADFAGTAPCYPRVEFTLDAGSTSELELSCGNEFLRLEGTFSAGDAFVADFERGVVYRSGQPANSLIAVSSRFFGIEPGERTLFLKRKTSGVWQSFSGTCAYRPRWYA